MSLVLEYGEYHIYGHYLPCNVEIGGVSMISVNLNNSKYVSCIVCNKKRDKYKKIYSINIGDSLQLKFNLCTECMSILVSKMVDAFNMEVPNNERTDYDIELEIESKLRILLNKKISKSWNEDCQRELDSLEEEKMCNSNRLIYRQICDW